MSLINFIWSTIPAACLTLALIHGLIWWRRREALANGLFALMAVAVFCITTLHLHHEEKIRNLLGVPPTYVQGCLLPVGRLQAGRTFSPARRRPLEEVVARDRWDGPAL